MVYTSTPPRGYTSTPPPDLPSASGPSGVDTPGLQRTRVNPRPADDMGRPVGRVASSSALGAPLMLMTTNPLRRGA